MIKIVILLLILLFLYLINNHNVNENFTNMEYDVYFINLDRSKDRYNKIVKRMKDEKLNYKRWKAVDGSLLDLDDLKKKNIITKDNKMIKGAIGCSLSHISLWKNALKERKNIIVLEDDVLIEKNFKKKLNKYLEQLPNNWDILYLGASNINGKKYSKNLLKPNKMKNKNSTHNTGMYGMLINKRYLKKLIKNNEPIGGNIDKIIKNKLFDNSQIYICNPPIILHDNNVPSMRRVLSNKSATTSWFSDIQNKVVIN